MLPVVTASGALIKETSQHETLFRATFDKKLIGEMLPFLANLGYDPVMYTDSFGLGYDFHLATKNTKSPELQEFLDRNDDSIHYDADLITNPPDGVFAGFVMGTQKQMHDVEAKLLERWPNELYVHVIRSPRYFGYMCEIAPAGVCKWSGVQFVAKELGVTDAEICAVGDDVNDLPMIAAAGLGIAMGNAPENVRNAAHRVTHSLDDDGLVQVVSWILDGDA